MEVIPEGGSNALAAQGCTALGRELAGACDVAAVACGTGGTLAGLAAGLSSGQRALGVPVLRGGFLGPAVERLQREAFGGPSGNWSLDERFAFGGYARSTPELEAFAADFEDRHGLPVERVYVAKLLFALTALAEEGAFAPGTRVSAVITGTPTRRPFRIRPSPGRPPPPPGPAGAAGCASSRRRSAARRGAGRRPRARPRSSPSTAAGRCRPPTPR